MRRLVALLGLLIVVLLPMRVTAAVFCDGTDDEIALDHLGVDGATRLSFAFWVYIEDITEAEAGILSKGSTAPVTSFYLAIGTGSNTLWFNFGQPNNYGLFAATANTWNHWVVVYDGNQTGNSNRLRAWQDGAELAANSFTGTITPSIDASSSPVMVCQNNRSGTGAGAHGRVRLDHLMMWVGTALTPGEAMSQYWSPTPVVTPNLRLWMRFEGIGADLGANLAPAQTGEVGTVSGAQPSFGPPAMGAGGE